MGDYPTKHHRIETYLTDHIFGYALSNVSLKASL